MVIIVQSMSYFYHFIYATLEFIHTNHPFRTFVAKNPSFTNETGIHHGSYWPKAKLLLSKKYDLLCSTQHRQNRYANQGHQNS